MLISEARVYILQIVLLFLLTVCCMYDCLSSLWGWILCLLNEMKCMWQYSDYSGLYLYLGYVYVHVADLLLHHVTCCCSHGNPSSLDV